MFVNKVSADLFFWKIFDKAHQYTCMSDVCLWFKCGLEVYIKFVF